jgi:uncharacterized membrane protein YgcG
MPHAGIVFFLTLRDRHMHVSTGSGVKGVLTDAHVEAVVSRARRMLRADHFDAAVLGAASDMLSVLRRPAGPHDLTEEMKRLAAESSHSFLWFCLAVFAIFVIAVMVNYHKVKRDRQTWEQCRRRLLEIQRVRDGAVVAQSAAPVPPASAPGPATSPSPAAAPAPAAASDTPAAAGSTGPSMRYRAGDADSAPAIDARRSGSQAPSV